MASFYGDWSSLSTVLFALALLPTLYIGRRTLRYFRYLAGRQAKGCKNPPRYPHKDPILGYDYFLEVKEAGAKGRWLPNTKELFLKYGKTYEVNNLGDRMLHTMHVENLKHIFSTDSKNWGIQPLRDGLAVPFFTDGINTVDGEHWRHSRALIRPGFAHGEISNLSTFSRHADRFLDQLPTDGSEVDLQELLSRLFLDATTEFLFGESMDSLVPTEHERTKTFINSFDYCVFGLGARVKLGPLMFLHRDPKWHACIKVVHQWVDKWIDDAIKRAKQEKAGGEGSSSDNFVLIDEMAKQTQDKDDLRSQILAVFMQGRDGIAFSLSNVFHVLARRPDVYQKLRQEALAHGDREPTFDELKAMRYAHAVINEGFRTHPTAPQVIRAALQDTTLPVGGGPDGQSPIYVQKGDTIMASIWGVHQDKDIWGSDAAEFRPARWEKPVGGWNFVPFLGGPRVCPAQQMTLIQETYILHKFARAFERIENTDPNPWTEARRLGFQSKYGVKVKLTPAAH